MRGQGRFEFPDSAVGAPLRVGVTGAGGLVGSALSTALEASGATVKRWVRRPASVSGNELAWDPVAGTIDSGALAGLDAMVHLAGENIAGGRWSVERKERIRSSRVEGTRLIAGALAQAEKGPRVLVSASAIGYYGDRGEERIDEESSPGTGFLAETCQEWEQSVAPAVEAGVRVVLLRIGVVLSRHGGALARMLLPFRLGLGGRLGNGRQYMSWIALDDLVRIVLRALSDERLEGPVNAVAPNPVRNAEFTARLGAALRRPAVLPVPAFALGLLLGEMGRELLLAGARIEPRSLLDSDFEFRFPDLDSALRFEIRAAERAGSRERG
jgi:uncharacterized protein (TIGR01777 family)